MDTGTAILLLGGYLIWKHHQAHPANQPLATNSASNPATSAVIAASVPGAQAATPDVAVSVASQPSTIDAGPSLLATAPATIPASASPFFYPPNSPWGARVTDNPFFAELFR